MQDYAAFRRAVKDSPESVTVTTDIPADLLTPASVYLRLAGEDTRTGFLFESVEGGESVGRYSFIGVDPIEEIRMGESGGIYRVGRRRRRFGVDELFGLIRGRLHRVAPPTGDGRPAPMSGGWVGYFGYDCVRLFERLPGGSADVQGHPWVCLGLYDLVVVFDHVRQSARATVTVHPEGHTGRRLQAVYDRTRRRLDRIVARLARPQSLPRLTEPTPAPARANMTPRAYHEGVRAIKRHIARGDIFQGVLSQRFSVGGPVRPFDVYRRLRRTNPSPYMYFLKFGDLAIAGSSPETLVQKFGVHVTTRPIAGTRPRGETAREDAKLARQLAASPKEKAEHVMLVDLGRNDLGRVSRPGTVATEQFCAIDRYSHVMHLVSRVTGRTRRGVDALDVLRAAFPAGTVSGAPKIRAMEIIDQLEPDRRGIYAGSVGYIDWYGNMDMAIAIRTAVVDRHGASVQAGAGIVADSDPVREYRETCSKAAAPLAAIGGALPKGIRP